MTFYKESRNSTGTGNRLLVPVDFLSSSLLSCRIALDLGRRLSLRPLIFHAHPQSDIPDNQINKSLESMSSLVGQIHKMREEFGLQEIEFDTLVSEGIAEEKILETARKCGAALIVMSNRGRHKRQEALVGSVTAEIIDSCRLPVFTVPEFIEYSDIESITNLVFFCNLDSQDVNAMALLMNMFGKPEVNITLVPVVDARKEDVEKSIRELRDEFEKIYPQANFNYIVLPVGTFRSSFESYLTDSPSQLLVVPNKKRNIFSRLFRPGMAHKLLFERDLPLLALPV